MGDQVSFVRYQRRVCLSHIRHGIKRDNYTAGVSTHYASIDAPSKFSFSQRTARIPFKHCLSTSQQSQFNNKINQPTHTQPSNTLPFILSYPRINHTYRRPSLHQHAYLPFLSLQIEPSSSTVLVPSYHSMHVAPIMARYNLDFYPASHVLYIPHSKLRYIAEWFPF